MPRLIDADKLKEHYSWWEGGSQEMTLDEAKRDFDTIIGLQPTVDAEPVRHGRWRRGTVFTYLVTCSECGDVFDLTERTACWKYCSNCGAKMDNAGEVEDG